MHKIFKIMLTAIMTVSFICLRDVKGAEMQEFLYSETVMQSQNAVISDCDNCTKILKYSEPDNEDEINKILSFEYRNENQKEFFDNLCNNAGTSFSDWMILTMYRNDISEDYDFYIKAIDSYVQKNKDLKATDYERIALVKSCFNKDSEWVSDVIDSNENTRIMDYIYGLILLNSNSFDTENKYQDYVSAILKYQLKNGGFSLSGENADPDVTAMVLQALAPYEDEYKTEIEAAINCLSSLQNEDGTFSSYGVKNAESTSQVIMALCAMNLDVYEDLRFVKDENLYEALKKFKNEDGGYRHKLEEGPSDGMATLQVLEAYVSLKLQKEGKGYIFDFSNIESADGQTLENIEISQTDKKVITGKNLKFIIMAGTGLVAGFIIIFLIIKKRKKTTILIIVVALTAEILFSFAKIETKTEHYNSIFLQGNVNTFITVEGYDDMIIDRREIYLNEGDTVFDQLKAALTEKEINFDFDGNVAFNNVYIKSINGLGEFDHGPQSGWIYTVNGESPKIGCSGYVLLPEDEVIWKYVESGDYY